jgi:hypothetical protein
MKKSATISILIAFLILMGWACLASAQEARLSVIGDEDLYVTSKTAAIQLESGVSVRAQAATVFFEGETIRFKAYGTATSTVGALIDPDLIQAARFGHEDIWGSNFVLDEDSLTTGATLYIIYYGK